MDGSKLEGGGINCYHLSLIIGAVLKRVFSSSRYRMIATEKKAREGDDSRHGPWRLHVLASHGAIIEAKKISCGSVFFRLCFRVSSASPIAKGLSVKVKSSVRQCATLNICGLCLC